jgi:hypothetical protein
VGKLKEARAALIADLNVLGVPVMDGWQLNAEPPCVLLTPAAGRSYVDGGEQFASFVINIDVVVLVRDSSVPDQARDALEDLLEELLRNSADWSLDGVDAPQVSAVPGSTVEFFGTVVHLGKTVYL